MSRPRFSRRAIVVLAMAPLMSSGAYAMQSNLDPGSSPPSVLAMDQAANGKAVAMTYVFLPTDGYVAVYGVDDAGKKTGEALGYTPLAKGDHRKVKVELATAPKAGAKLRATLYKDVDKDKKLDVKKDQPFAADERTAEGQFQIRG